MKWMVRSPSGEESRGEVSEINIKHKWEEHCAGSASIIDNASSIGVWLRRKRLEILSEILLDLDPNMSVIDVG